MNTTTPPVTTVAVNDGLDTAPIFGMPTRLSAAVGEKGTLTVTAHEAVTFISADPSILAVGDTEYDAATQTSRVTYVGISEGTVSILAVQDNRVSASVILGTVYESPAVGHEMNHATNALFTVTPDKSPASEKVINLGDGKTATKWLSYSNTAEIVADLGRAVKISRYTLTSANDDAVRDPSAFSLYGSYDGEVWTLLDKVEKDSFKKRFEEHSFSIDQPAAYRYYKLHITKNNGADKTQLSEFGLYEIGESFEKADAPVKTPLVSDIKGIELSIDSLHIFEDDSATLTAKAISENGSKSRVRFLATEAAAVSLSTVYDEASGTTTLTLTGKGTDDAKLVAYTEDGLAVKVIDLSIIGEGSAKNLTSHFTFEGMKDGKATQVGALLDDVRKTVLSAKATELTVIFTAKGDRELINRYAIVGGSDLAKAPSAWKFYGSQDKKTWLQLDARENETFQGQYLRRLFDVENTTPYRYYKLVLTGDTETIAFSEIQLFEMGRYPTWALGPFVKVDEANPILKPNDVDYFIDPITGKPCYWSNEALYNPAAVVKDGVIAVLYRSQDHPLVSRVGLALSMDGIHFSNLKEPVLYPENDEFYPFEVGGGDEDPRVIKDENGTYYMYYSSYNREKGICRLYVATSTDLEHWTKHGNAIGDAYNGKYKDTWAKSGSVICDMVGEEFIARKMDDGKYYMYFGEGILYVATSTDLIHWTPIEDENGGLLHVLDPRPGYYDSRLVECGPQAIYTEYGIHLIYNGANADPEGSGDSMIVYNAYCPGQILIDPKDPTKVLKITETFFMYPEMDYELEGLVNNVCFVEGLVYYKGSWYLYYGTADSRLAVAVYTPEKRDDTKLSAAIASAEEKGALSQEAKAALKVAKEAAVAAIYTQEQVDEIAAKLCDLIR